MRADAQRSRRLLLDAASELITEVGLQVPLEAIARRAGVGIATLYRHFPRREDLVTAVAIDVLTRTRGEAQAALAEEPDGFAALRRYMHRALDACAPAVMPLIADEVGRAPEVTVLLNSTAAAQSELIASAQRAGSLRGGVQFPTSVLPSRGSPDRSDTASSRHSKRGWPTAISTSSSTVFAKVRARPWRVQRRRCGSYAPCKSAAPRAGARADAAEASPPAATRRRGLSPRARCRQDSLDALLVGRPVGTMYLVCYLRDGDRVFETYWTNFRGVEAMDNSDALMDLTAYGRQEPWEDSPPSWPQQWGVAGAKHRIRTNGRPIAQWSRVEAGRSDDLRTAAH